MTKLKKTMHSEMLRLIKDTVDALVAYRGNKKTFDLNHVTHENIEEAVKLWFRFSQAPITAPYTGREVVFAQDIICYVYDFTLINVNTYKVFGEYNRNGRDHIYEPFGDNVHLNGEITTEQRKAIHKGLLHALYLHDSGFREDDTKRASNRLGVRKTIRGY